MRLFPKRVDTGHGQSWILWRWLDIPGTDGVYLTRLTLFRCPWFQVLLHWIYEPDWAPDCHDHPWPFVGIVLRGGYVEYRVDLDRSDRYEIERTRRVLRRFSVNAIDSRTPHRVASVRPRTLTLLVTGSKRKAWGFYKRTAWGFYKRTGQKVIYGGAYRLRFIPWREYVDRPGRRIQ